MSYFNEAFRKYYHKNRITGGSDGEGGYITSWVNGAILDLSIDFGTASEQREAEAQKLKKVGTVTMPKNSILRYNDYIEDVETGEIYRVTSDPNDTQVPKGAVYQVKVATIEKAELPDD